MQSQRHLKPLCFQAFIVLRIYFTQLVIIGSAVMILTLSMALTPQVSGGLRVITSNLPYIRSIHAPDFFSQQIAFLMRPSCTSGSDGGGGC